jgi:hypothetical protein
MQLQQNNNTISKSKIDDDFLDDSPIKTKKSDFNPIDEEPIDDDNSVDDYDNDWSDLQSPATGQKYSDLLKELTDFNPIIKDVVYGWSGFSYNVTTGKYERNDILRPLMNPEGVNWAIIFLKNYLKKTNFITNISEKEYTWLYQDIAKIVWTDFAVKDDFGIKDNMDRHMIGESIIHTALLMLTGAGGGKYSQFMGSTTMRTEHVNVSPQGQLMMPQQMQKQKVGLFGMAKRMLIGGN